MSTVRTWHGDRVRVNPSSLAAEPAVWLTILQEQGVKKTSALLTVQQAKEIRDLLTTWLDDGFTIDLGDCPRCGGAHGPTDFQRLSSPVEVCEDLPALGYWAPCPDNGQPILLSEYPVVGDRGA
jgi:hypothetical protein